jgi:hypothetical protein
MKTTLETAECACRTPRTNRRHIIASGRHTPPACYTDRIQKMVAEEIIPHTCQWYKRARSSSQGKKKGILTFIVLISTAYVPMPSSCDTSDTSTMLRIRLQSLRVPFILQSRLPPLQYLQGSNDTSHRPYASRAFSVPQSPPLSVTRTRGLTLGRHRQLWKSFKMTEGCEVRGSAFWRGSGCRSARARHAHASLVETRRRLLVSLRSV